MCYLYKRVLSVILFLLRLSNRHTNNYISFKLVPTNVSTDIRVSNATNDTLSVQWSYETVQNRPAQYFIVTATRNDTNITEATQRLDVLFWADDVFRITLTGLKEFKWYIVRVAAGNLMGLARYSDMLVLNQTLEGGKIMWRFVRSQETLLTSGVSCLLCEFSICFLKKIILYPTSDAMDFLYIQDGGRFLVSFSFIVLQRFRNCSYRMLSKI